MADIELVIKIPNDIYHRVVVSPRCTTFLDAFRDRDIFIKALQTGEPLPKGHGRLIDADALEKKMCDREEELGDDRAMWESSAVSVALDMFAPTIIEAESEEKNE